MSALTGTEIKKHLNLFSLYLMYCSTFLYFNNPTLGQPAFKLFLITSIISILWHLPQIWRSPAFFLFGAAILIQIASWMVCKNNFPQYAESDPDFKRLGYLFLFIPIAWILQANNRAPWMLLFVFFVGLCIMPFTRGEGLSEFIEAKRSGFGLRNAQHPALMFATLFVALVVFRKRALDAYASSRAKVIIALATAMLYCISIVAITYTRGVFLGLLAGILLAGAGLLMKNKKPRKREVLLTVALSIIMIVSLSIISNPLTKWLREVDTVKSLASGDIADIPYKSSSGVRIHTWIEGWHWFTQSPLVGWGENGKSLAIQESSTLPGSIRNKFGHLHNSYIETLVNNGILGLFIIAALLGWLAMKIRKGCLELGIRDVQVFTIIAGTLWLVANIFESFMFYKTGVLLFGICSAALLNASGYRFGATSVKANQGPS
ncbi:MULTISPECIES: O-antigen ligase family protein [unclassified Ketobacter]|uniref:O-antigen ligase family protein n=1 Tax=unclassified Ketobacter TaxID=2639109 RepID=UPI000F2BF4C0|nr:MULTISPECIES: O-antigen ligase family protein [unclassified Ketobacter]MCK5789731.1 O-antigen ligase family protein [Ketobacter sp.]RLT91748.1 MAG: O-antigen ligase domain-containing protein [Ketobacter sp. GenoA1]RLT92453.1 MAG: O-antigen ligase domain-containing protein [Ketobacter sp.]